MDELVKEAVEALETSHAFDRDNRKEAMEDLRFAAGFHWSDAAKAERKGRPMITINRSQQFLRQVSNPIRQNMPILKVETDNSDDAGDPEIANGLLRRIQYNSSAAHVYATAVEHAVACGIGWFRVSTDYKDYESFDQEIFIKRVVNPLSVYPDPGAVDPHRGDMMWCLVSEPMPVKTFKTKWPKAVATHEFPVPSAGGASTQIVWGSGDWMRVAEYWRRKEVEQEVALLKTGDVVNLSTLNKQALEYIKANGLVQQSRKAKTFKVVMTMVSGHEQLEEEYEFPCEYLPLIPVIGAEVPLEKGTYRHGVLRFQREPQQLSNYFLSVAAETMGQQPKTPYLVTAKMITKFKGLWDNAGRDATPYLPYEPDPSAPGAKPERVTPAPLPAGLVQLTQLMSDDMKATTGQYDASLGAKSNETSGVAIAARQEQGNQATYHYVDNLEHSLEHLGRILLKMMPKVYDTERTMRIQTEDDSEKEVTINKPMMSLGGVELKHNDLSRMKYDAVRVVLGPSYASRRAEAVQQLTQLIQVMPQIGEVAGDIIAKNLDFDGAEQLAERLKVLLPPQVLQIENPDMGQAQQPPPDPMAEMQMQGAQQMMGHEVASAEAKAAQEGAKAQQEAAKVQGVELDNALKMKKLQEPPPRPEFNGRNAGNPPAN